MKTISLGSGCLGGTRRFNHVCADCRVSKKDSATPSCHKCGQPMYCLGERRKVPRKRNLVAWRNIKISADHWKERNVEKSEPAPLAGKSPRAEIIKESERTVKNLIERKMPAQDEA